MGGNIDFDLNGNLFLSTGDDTNPFESDGFAPIDDSPKRNPAFDARRSAGNTNDLRGKILRIHPTDGGGYAIPLGNLFPQGTPPTRPEIYAMGLRIRSGLRSTARAATCTSATTRRIAHAESSACPAGHGRWMLIRARPTRLAVLRDPDIPYIDYDFATETSGAPFNCNAATNDSPHNTGLTRLPPVTQPDVWYSYEQSPLFPELGPEGRRRHRADGRPGV